MDISPYLELKPAPRAVFDDLAARRSRPRFMVPTPEGDWRAVTWGGFAAEIREVALWLAHKGLATGERAAIFAPNRVEWGSAALAIQSVGGVMVPVYAGSTAEQAGYICGHSDAKVLFVDSRVLLERVFRAFESYRSVAAVVLMDDGINPGEVLGALRAQGVSVPTDEESLGRVHTWSAVRALGRSLHALSPVRFQDMLRSVSLDAQGLMLYTSGTTGNPKGVPLTHRNVAVNGRDWLECNGPMIPEHSVDLLWLPMSHIFGFGELCLGNSLGFLSYLSDPMTVLSRLPEVQPEVFMSVPAYWEKLAQGVLSEPEGSGRAAKLAELTGGKLRFCLSGGAGLKRSVKELFLACGVLILEGYGLTECSPTLTLNRPDAYRFDTVGLKLPSVELKLEADGEILARGPSVFGGYHKDPEATRAAFTDDGWFRTGDVGRFTDEGFLQIVDRKKDILVTAGGKNVAPANLELMFRTMALFAHVVVYGDGERYIVAGVWLDPGIAASHKSRGEDLVARVRAGIQEVNRSLAGYESIKRFVVLDEPLTVEGEMLTSSLKVRRKRVYLRYAEVFRGLYAGGGESVEAPAP